MEIFTKWFAEEAPTNAKGATATLGTGDDGVITVTYKTVGTSGNALEAAIVVATGNDKPMTAALASGVLTITLATGAAGAADDTKNTAELIAGAIDALSDFDASYSGTGATAFAEATSENVAFSGGQFGTKAPVPYTWLYIGTEYYTNIAPNDEYGSNWRKVTFTTF